MEKITQRKAAGGMETVSAADEVMLSNYSIIETCPKFIKCSAPICPLDPEWERRAHGKEDRVCFYMMEYAKADSKRLFEGAGRGYLYQTISRVISEIRSRHYSINRAYIRANKSGSRMNRKIGGKP
jgi:hypothetical protein